MHKKQNVRPLGVEFMIARLMLKVHKKTAKILLKAIQK